MRVGMRLGRLLPAALVLAATLAPSVAAARTAREERYPVERVWNAAVRMLRVDLGFEIVERDRDAGFLLFTWRDNGRNSTASLELMPAQVEGISGSRVVVSINSQPSYTEQYLLTRLARKLRDDYGEPPAPSRAEPARPAQPREGEGNGNNGGNGGNGNNSGGNNGNGGNGNGGNGNGGNGNGGNGNGNHNGNAPPPGIVMLPELNDRDGSFRNRSPESR